MMALGGYHHLFSFCTEVTGRKKENVGYFNNSNRSIRQGMNRG